MHIKRITLSNIRGHEELEWSLDAKVEPRGWHVVLGDNGSGKSTFLRGIALALVGPTEAMALRQNWSTWLRHGTQKGSTTVAVKRDGKWDQFSASAVPPKGAVAEARVDLLRQPDQSVTLLGGEWKVDPRSTLWGDGGGWFSASYGPFRRFTGGDKDVEKLFYSSPKLARHLSVFGESVALTECLEWLQRLRFKQLENPDDVDGRLLEPLKAFVNQPNFLPHGATLESISSAGVKFVDANGLALPVDELSDGYRSVLSMTFELIRQLALTFGAERIFDPADATRVLPPGVVLIDEVDAHLHPTWQRRIGPWFRACFPNIQFIVTTHSPLVCQAADHGTVFRLAKPGSDEPSRMLTGTELNRIVYGNVLDAYASGAFGEGITRSDASLEKLERLGSLNRKDVDEGLLEDEAREQQTLREMFPTTASVLRGEPASRAK